MRKALAVALGAVAGLAASAGPALAQSIVDPTYTPIRNTGGWVNGAAYLLAIVTFLVLLLVVIVGYMRYAPRFSPQEGSTRTVHADRVRLGHELPRRSVDVSQAAPIVVAPPEIPVTASAASVSAAAAPAAPAAPPAGAAAAQPATPAPAPTEPAAPEAAPPAPPAAAPASAGAQPQAPAAPAATEDRHEVALDQETFDRTLAELVAKGTDRRVAEGQAKRAAMIAARKKAAGA